ncbi:MAG: sulfatase-like hydrolase/transferase [Planctomycetaceae bacterium]|nr:sulfatase-like hydrolase/transferase [Planctomycetaceae bacterium]
MGYFYTTPGGHSVGECELTNAMKSVICLLVDRLHIGYIGAYGNTEVETPFMDRLASESFVADRFYIDSTVVAGFCRSFWHGKHAVCDASFFNEPTLMQRLNDIGCLTILLTDDQQIAFSPDAGDFSDVQFFEAAKNTKPCDDVAQTYLCSVMATIMATAQSLAESKKPFFLCCPIRGFAGNWDFPVVFREKYCGDDDPEPYMGIVPPLLRQNDPVSENGVKNHEANENKKDDGKYDDEGRFIDFRQSVSATYSGGVTMFDELLEVLMTAVDAGEFGRETLFLLAGTRGFPLGDRQQIGFSEAPPEKKAEFPRDPLCSALVHVPLFVRFPNGFGATVRSDALLQPSDLNRLLAEWLDILPKHQNRPIGGSMLSLIREDGGPWRDCLLIVSESVDVTELNDMGQTICFVTPAWFLRKEIPPRTENDECQVRCRNRLNADAPEVTRALYVKPDDRWDVNDVSGRCIDIVEQLDQTATDWQKRLRNNGMDDFEPFLRLLDNFL